MHAIYLSHLATNVLQQTKLVLVVPLIGCAHSGKEDSEKIGSAMVLRAAVRTAMDSMLTTSPVVACREAGEKYNQITEQHMKANKVVFL